MRLRSACFGLCLALLLVLPSATFGAGGIVVPGNGYGNKNMPKPVNEDEVLRFAASRDGVSMGHKQLMVGFTRLDGTGNIVAYVGHDPKTYELDDKVAGPVMALKQGDIVTVTLAQMNGMLTISKIKAVTVKPGEDTPHGFVYQESFNDQNSGAPVIRFTKYEQSVEVTLPNVKDDKGKPTPDPDLVNAVQALKQGDVVYATFGQVGRVPVLTAVYPYSDPQTGKVSKVSDQAMDNNGKTIAVDIETSDGKTITALVPGKITNKHWIADVNMLRIARGLKAGTEVVYMARTDGDKTFLIDIAKAPPAPKTPAAKPSAAAPAQNAPAKSK